MELIDRLLNFPGGEGAEALCREAAEEIVRLWNERDDACRLANSRTADYAQLKARIGEAVAKLASL